MLTWLCLAAGLSAGLFFTSDCLSEEKREGTLGLLFLTDLRGYDVALGKLLATSLRGFYALLAVLPILAITLLMGGVTGAQYWKSALALVNALFFSLAAGMAVSAVSRDSQKALTATLLLLLLLALGGPMADGTIAAIQQRGFEPRWSLSSPGYVLVAASAWCGPAYWIALATTHLLGWAMLALACALVPHTWQETKEGGRGPQPGLGLCLAVRRRAAAAAAAPEADRAAAGGLAGLPGTLAVAGVVDHGAPHGGRLRGRADQHTAAGGLDRLELCRGRSSR